MYKMLVCWSFVILVMTSSIDAAEQGTRHITGKSLTVHCEDAASFPRTATESSSAPMLDIGFDRINPVYTEGERVVITVTVRKDIEGKRLYLFNVDSSGGTSVLFPNAWHEQQGVGNTIKGGTQLTIPSPENKGFHIEVVGPSFGTERVIGVLTDEPIDPAKVGAKSFTAANVTPIDSVKFKGLQAVVESKVNSIVVEKSLRTTPKTVSNSPAPLSSRTPCLPFRK